MGLREPCARMSRIDDPSKHLPPGDGHDAVMQTNLRIAVVRHHASRTLGLALHDELFEASGVPRRDALGRFHLDAE